MNSHTRIRIFTIIAFILIAGVLYIGYNRMQENTRSLLQTVDENARPAEDLLRIKELWISFNRTSTDIRSFAVTRDDNYLSGFLEMKDTLIAGIDSLKAKAVTSSRPIDDLLELESALDKKVSIYDSLLEINYNRVMISAIEKMKPEDLEVDTASVVLNEGNFFQRSFTRKYSRKALQAKVDSMILARSERISSFKQNLSKIREEEERLLAEQSQKELALLADDKKVTGEIERLIKKLESDEQARIKEKAAASVKTAGEAAIAIRQIMIAGLVVIFLLVILVLRDLELAGKRRKELVEARLKAEKLARAKEEFMATMSHEIRTPLTSVIGFAAKLGETTLDPVQQRFMKAIAGSSEHLLSIVNDVLDFTRVDSGKLKFESVPFKVADIFVDVYDALVWKAEEKSIKLNLFIKPVETLLLHGDPVRLRQVLFNLVGNAIKFTHKGSVDITATFLNEKGSAVLLFKISDTGIGIPADKLEAIFGEFEQAESNTEKKYGGSGLGLAITKRVVEQQGGNVSVESSNGLGSVFSVRIPFTFGELESRETSFTEDVPEYPLKGLYILLAEDDPMIRELQTHSLEGLGAKVVVAEDGLQALELFKVNPVDIIIMDIQMPEMTGPEAVKIIRTNFPASRKNVPVIAMTANVLQHDLKRWMEEGMSDFVTKPFKEQELVDKINVLLNRSNVRPKPVEPVIVEETYSFSMEKPPVLYDLAELKATSQGNIGFVSKMINLFLTSSFASVNNLKFHLKQKNWEQLGKTAHRMIGSYKQMGMPYIAAMLKELESVAAEQKELGKAAWLVQQIDQNSTEVFRLLKNELEQLS
ncbi:MAG: response regulator [Bacteroidia bacterium]|nr:response regulator [Bacteroidia bacterium]